MESQGLREREACRRKGFRILGQGPNPSDPRLPHTHPGSWSVSQCMSLVTLSEELAFPEHPRVSYSVPSTHGQSHYYPSPPKVECGG